jgi:Amt family ammonium transporter
MAVTHIAASAGAMSWMFGEWVLRGRPSLLGLCSGLVAGLVAITPAAGFVTPGSALLIGFIAGLACYWGATGSSACCVPTIRWMYSACMALAASWVRC